MAYNENPSYVPLSDLPLSVSNGGTGAGTLTGVVVGNGTSALTATNFPQVSGLGIGASPGSTAGLTFDGTNFLTAYSTGTWSPTLANTGTAPSLTYASNGQVGRYTKIGPVVNFIYHIILATYTAGTGTCTIASLPFTSANVTNQTSPTTLSIQEVTYGSSVTYYNLNISTNATTGNITGIISAGAFVNLAANAPASNAVFGGSGWYSTS